eukprot:GHVR01005260.1.p1 GENE.GHVR01005260.1~~GHVR01005260.1.p1  ORF type:complete len:131 (-),score=53.30 GHVR01005260.1:16-408(-)
MGNRIGADISPSFVRVACYTIYRCCTHINKDIYTHSNPHVTCCGSHSPYISFDRADRKDNTYTDNTTTTNDQLTGSPDSSGCIPPPIYTHTHTHTHTNIHTHTQKPTECIYTHSPKYIYAYTFNSIYIYS